METNNNKISNNNEKHSEGTEKKRLIKTKHRINDAKEKIKITLAEFHNWLYDEKWNDTEIITDNRVISNEPIIKIKNGHPPILVPYFIVKKCLCNINSKRKEKKTNKKKEEANNENINSNPQNTALNSKVLEEKIAELEKAIIINNDRIMVLETELYALKDIVITKDDIKNAAEIINNNIEEEEDDFELWIKKSL